MKILQIAVMATSWTFAAIVPVGLGSYSDQLPAGMIAPTNSTGGAIQPAKTANITGAIPTNDWASSLVFQRNVNMPHPNPMFPHPWSVQADPTGLRLGFATGVATGTAFYAYGTPWDIAVGIPGQTNPATKLDRYTDWTVTASLYAGSLKATFGHGLPYVYVERSGTIELKMAGVPTVQSNQGGVICFSLGDRRYAAYAPSSSSWTVSGQIISTDLGANGYLSIAVLPDQTTATRDLFSSHAYAFVTGTQVAWTYDSTNAQSKATYSFTTAVKQGTETKPLTALYPHQWRNTVGVTYAGQTYSTPRGTMKLAATSAFSTQTQLPGVFPVVPFAAPNDSRYSNSQMTTLIQSWSGKSDGELVRRHADTYWTGKDLGRLAILTQLADVAGMAAEKNRFLTLLRTTLENWLTYTPGETNECFAYQSTWGSLIGLQASYGSGDELNDHHFHYGYYLMAGATVARMVPGWGSDAQWGGMMDLVAKDAANPERGSSFTPFLRNFDVYAGHSWASGHANFGDGNNQESSSESVNFSAGLLMWGEASGDKTLRDLGTFLYATEVQAIREYWFDVYNDVFPAAWGKNAAGMIWGGKVDHGTWFSGEPEMIHGINWLPLTGASLYLGMDPTYAAANYTEMATENGGDPNQWVDVAWGYRAFSNADEAWRMYLANPSYSPEDGESQPHIYSHILSLGALGELDTAIRGNSPSSAAFRKGSQTTYCAYNPTSQAKEFRFTNGVAFQVAAGSWSISVGAPVALRPTANRHAPMFRGQIRWFDLMGRRR
jgi:endoglucanase Acf2